jgi:hypothetical protein
MNGGGISLALCTAPERALYLGAPGGRRRVKPGHARDTLSLVGSHLGAGWYPQSKPAICLGTGARAEGEICENIRASYDDVS